LSDKEYQRAIADLVRLPELCQAVRAGVLDAFNSYDLTIIEHGRLCDVAQHQGMLVNCMLYRASRLVGITRRLPRTIELIRPALREIFDAYLLACPDAEAEFDREASNFAQFVVTQIDENRGELFVPVEALRTVIESEISSL
jgi:hypothetical protein